MIARELPPGNGQPNLSHEQAGVFTSGSTAVIRPGATQHRPTGSPHCLISACVKVGSDAIPASTSATLRASALIACSSQARCWSDSVTGFVGLRSFAPADSLLTCSSRPVLTPSDTAARPGPPYFALMPSYM